VSVSDHSKWTCDFCYPETTTETPSGDWPEGWRRWQLADTTPGFRLEIKALDDRRWETGEQTPELYPAWQGLAQALTAFGERVGGVE
jgi:hypothetical protein